MATRFYFPASGTPAATPPSPDSAWNVTTGFAAYPLKSTYSGTAKTSGTARSKGSTTANTNRLDRQYISDFQVAAGAISGTFSMVMRGLESATGADDWLQVIIKVVSADGATSRGTLYSGSTATAESATAGNEAQEFGTTLSTRIKNAISLSSVTAQDGDRILVEVGYRSNGTTSTHTATLEYGDPTGSSDYALTAGLTTTLVPWIEFSQTLTQYVDPNAFLVGEASIANNTSGSPHTLNTPAGMAVGDLVVLVQANNWYTLAALGTPTGTAVTTWQEQTVAQYDGGTDAHHVKVWIGTATAAGVQTVIANYASPSGGDEERFAQIFVFDAGAEFDTGDTNAQASGTTYTLPALTAADANSYLLGVVGNLVDTNFTFPGSMTALTERDVGGICTYRAAYEKISATGSTGTRSVTSSVSGAGFVTSLLIQKVIPPGGGGELAVDTANSPAMVKAVDLQAATTAAFNPPAGSVLVAIAQANHWGTTTYNGATWAMTNNGAALTWTQAVKRTNQDRGAAAPDTAIFVAPVDSARTGLTVTATVTAASGTSETVVLHVWVVTGADLADIVGAVSGGFTSSNINVYDTPTFTLESANSLVFYSGIDYSASGVPTSSDLNVTGHTGTEAAAISYLAGYKAGGAAGSTSTANMDAAGTVGANWTFAAAEIRVGAAAADLTKFFLSAA